MFKGRKHSIQSSPSNSIDGLRRRLAGQWGGRGRAKGVSSEGEGHQPEQRPSGPSGKQPSGHTQLGSRRPVDTQNRLTIGQGFIITMQLQFKNSDKIHSWSNF